MKLKKEIPEITAAVESLMALAGKHDRGQIIAWGDIERIAGSRLENRGRHIINKWRKRLRKDRDIVTLVADNVGVRLLTHQETAKEIPALRQRKAYRQVRRALREVETVDTSRLTDYEQRVLGVQKMNMAFQRRELYRSQQQAANGIHKTETNPRRRLA